MVRLVVTSSGGAVHEVKVVDGWFALAWIDPYGGPAFAGLKAYDANGRLVYQR